MARGPKKERVPGKASSTDLFGWLDALWTKAQPEGTPPTYVMHRFLASDPDLAPVARLLQNTVREPELVFRAWQGVLPRDRGAPRLSYIVAKKPPAEEAVVERLRTVMGESRRSAEQILEIVKLCGKAKTRALYAELGVEYAT